MKYECQVSVLYWPLFLVCVHKRVYQLVHTNVKIYICPFLDLSDYGWCRDNDHLQVVWDSPDNLRQVQRTVAYLTQGCRCKTGCTTRRCKCIKESTQCGPSCRCVNCKNIPSYITQQPDTEQELEEEIQEHIRQQDDQTDSEEFDATSDEDERLNRDVDNIMEKVFGVRF